MNRIIKFRAWDKYNKRMINRIEEDGEYAICFNGEIRCIKHGETPFNITLPQGLELQQYTGLTDKNGVEIYEGDICKNGDWEENANAYNYRIEVVEYIDKEACFRGWNFNIDGMTCEVVGNIYENPDLLNK